MENRKLVRGTNLAESYSQKLEGMELDDLKSAISMTETQISDLESQLAQIQLRLGNANHDRGLHVSYHGTKSIEVRADQAVIDDLVLERSRLSHDLVELRSNLLHLTGRTAFVGRQEAKHEANELEGEVKKGAKRLLVAIESAIDENERFDALRRSVKQTPGRWPFPYNKLRGSEIRIWTETVRNFIKKEK